MHVQNRAFAFSVSLLSYNRGNGCQCQLKRTSSIDFQRINLVNNNMSEYWSDCTKTDCSSHGMDERGTCFCGWGIFFLWEINHRHTACISSALQCCTSWPCSRTTVNRFVGEELQGIWRCEEEEAWSPKDCKVPAEHRSGAAIHLEVSPTICPQACINSWVISSFC